MNYNEGELRSKGDGTFEIYVQGVWFPVKSHLTEYELRIKELERQNIELRAEVSTLKAMQRRS